MTWEVVANYSLLYHVKGSHPALRPYMLMAHIDVVAADPDQWEVPPFSGDIVDGFIYGRGTIDDKHQVMVSIDSVGNLLQFHVS